MSEINLTVEHDELCTLIAALSHYKHSGMGDPFNRPDHIQDLATNFDEDTSLNDDGIDRLASKLISSKR